METTRIEENAGDYYKGNIFDMWMASYTQDEIAEAVNMTQQAIDKRLKELQLLENFPKVVKLSALYEDDFKIPIYNGEHANNKDTLIYKIRIPYSWLL